MEHKERNTRATPSDPYAAPVSGIEADEAQWLLKRVRWGLAVGDCAAGREEARPARPRRPKLNLNPQPLPSEEEIT